MASKRYVFMIARNAYSLKGFPDSIGKSILGQFICDRGVLACITGCMLFTLAAGENSAGAAVALLFFSGSLRI